MHTNELLIWNLAICIDRPW